MCARRISCLERTDLTPIQPHFSDSPICILKLLKYLDYAQIPLPWTGRGQRVKSPGFDNYRSHIPRDAKEKAAQTSGGW
jgi:hypothetical protein